mgnify:CR=1 FL=1
MEWAHLTQKVYQTDLAWEEEVDQELQADNKQEILPNNNIINFEWKYFNAYRSPNVGGN